MRINSKALYKEFFFKAPYMVHMKKSVLEHAVFLLEPLLSRSEITKPVSNYVQKHLYDPNHVPLYIIYSHALEFT